MAPVQNHDTRPQGFKPETSGVAPGTVGPHRGTRRGRAHVYLAGTLALIAGLLAPAGCPSASSTPPPINVAVGLQAEYIDANAAFPQAFAAAEDGRVFFTEKNTGLIRVIKDGAVLATPFASVPVNYADDRGLLGIALHPAFNLNGRVYVFYSRSETGEPTADPRAIVDHRIVYFDALGGGDVADGSETFVVSLPVGLDTTRIGGAIAFAPDRTLYVGFGDTTDQDAAQIAGLLWGKILRYNEDGTVPSSNPVADSAVYAQGLCDPRSIVFDPESGVAFVNDHRAVGAGTYQIVRILAGKNYGWPLVVGAADTTEELDFAAQNSEYVDPIIVSGTAGFAGVAFNPSTKYGSSARGQLFYGLITGGQVARLPLSADRTAADTPEIFVRHLPTPLITLAFTPAGTLYVGTTTAILRVITYP